MAIKQILYYPDPILREPTREVVLPIAEEIRILVADMIETMYATDGAGLAAIQIGSAERVFVVDGRAAGAGEDSEPIVFVNPEITALSEETELTDEGCLSFPGIYLPVKRSVIAHCRALTLEGKPFEVIGQGLYARALQHEIDHLNGRLLIDHVGPVKRELVRRQLKRAQAEDVRTAVAK